MGHRTSIRAAALAMVATLSVPAWATPLVVPGREYPATVLRFCPALQSAQQQADLSWEFGRGPYDLDRLRASKHPECQIVVVPFMLDYQEPTIPAFTTWAITYDASSQSKLSADFQGAPLTIPYSMVRQEVRVYVGRVLAEDGTWYKAWIEVAREPYILMHLKMLGWL